MIKLKTAFWGYKKTQVCEYIDRLSDELEKKYSEEIEKLLIENMQLKKQLEENNDVLAVSEIIIEAKNFANGLKEKALAEYEEQTRKSQLETETTLGHIRECEEKLAFLRTAIKDVLAETDNNLHSAEKELDNLEKQVKI